jgi:hypothetical protein
MYACRKQEMHTEFSLANPEGPRQRLEDNVKMDIVGFEVLTAVVMKNIIFWDVNHVIH